MILCLTVMMSVLTMSAQSIYDFNVKNDAGEEASRFLSICWILFFILLSKPIIAPFLVSLSQCYRSFWRRIRGCRSPRRSPPRNKNGLRVDRL